MSGGSVAGATTFSCKGMSVAERWRVGIVDGARVSAANGSRVSAANGSRVSAANASGSASDEIDIVRWRVGTVDGARMSDAVLLDILVSGLSDSCLVGGSWRTAVVSIFSSVFRVLAQGMEN